MEIINQYLVLLLSGIIIGGIITLSLTRRRDTRTVEFTPQHSANATINSSIWFVGTLLFLFFFILFQKLDTEKAAAKSLPPNEQIMEGQVPKQPFATPASSIQNNLEELAQTTRHLNQKPAKFFIQVAAFDNYQNAERQKSMLSQHIGFSIFISKKTGHTTPYKLLVGGFASRKKANQFIKKTGITGFITEGEEG